MSEVLNLTYEDVTAYQALSNVRKLIEAKSETIDSAEVCLGLDIANNIILQQMMNIGERTNE